MVYELQLQMAAISAVTAFDLLRIGIRIVCGAASGEFASALIGRIIGAAVTGRVELYGVGVFAGLTPTLLGNLPAPSSNDRVISCCAERQWQQCKSKCKSEY
jgi:hypothetical protein